MSRSACHGGDHRAGRGRGVRPFAAGLFVLLALLSSVLPARGDAFRSIRVIRRPGDGAPGGGSARAGVPLRPVSQAVVANGVQRLIDAWNARELGSLWRAEPFDQSRLPDLLASRIPREAYLRVLAIEGQTTVEQKVTPGPPGSGQVKVTSTVVALVRTQLELNDEVTGALVRLEGLNEFGLQVTELVVR